MSRGGPQPNSGRKPGSKNKTTLEKARRIIAGVELAAKIDNLTEEQIQALTPRDVFRLLLQEYVRKKDWGKAQEVAKDWAPYEHAKRSETLNLTPEEVRRIADTARSEAARRGISVEDAE
ncbi:MAG: hypothetical protein P4L90_26020 [Rhodopila sp.]|nr:hypothetical protein [Rhodopila sp.]